MLIRSLILKQRASLIDHMGKSPPRFNSWVRKIPWRRDRLPTPVFLGFPCGSAGKESACNAGDLGSIHEPRRSPGEGNGNPLQHSYLENPMDRGAWHAAVHRVGKSWTRLKLLSLQAETWLSPLVGEWCTPGILWVQASAAAQHSLMHGMALHNQ